MESGPDFATFITVFKIPAQAGFKTGRMIGKK